MRRQDAGTEITQDRGNADGKTEKTPVESYIRIDIRVAVIPVP
jgi:hypothetical protein